MNNNVTRIIDPVSIKHEEVCFLMFITLKNKLITRHYVTY